MAEELSRRSPAQWPRRFDAHCEDVAEYLGLISSPTALTELWGLEQGVAAGEAENEADRRLMPDVQRQMHQRLVDQIVASPSGLSRADAQVRQWRTEAKAVRAELIAALATAPHKLMQSRTRLAAQDWQMRYLRAIRRTPTLGGALLRALLITGLVGAIALLYLWLVQRSWNMTQDGVALAGFGTGAILAALLAFRVTANRVGALRRKRLAQVQSQLSDALQRDVRSGLLRGYDTLIALLDRWAEMLSDAQDELHDLSTPPLMPTPGAAESSAGHLYTPHLNTKLWEHCLDHLRSVMDSQGQRSEDRLDTLWGDAGWRGEMRRICAGRRLAGVRKRSGLRLRRLPSLSGQPSAARLHRATWSRTALPVRR